MENTVPSFVEKASALILLKDDLGPFYDEQKQQLLDLFVSSGFPLTQAATGLKQLKEIGFIDAPELSSWLSKVMTAGKAAQPSQSVSSPPTTAPKNTDQSANPILNIGENAADVGENKFIPTFTNSVPSKSNPPPQNNLNNNNATPQNAELVPADGSASVHLWGKDCQMIVLKLENGTLPYFCYLDLKEDENSVDKKGEHVVFCLDISASMNHDEKGVYCAPKSPDHPASSIKKARNLIPSLTMASLKRHASVSIIPWNYKVYDAIQFTPEMFIDKETGEFVEDQKMEDEIRKQTSESVFVAKGGTNIEAALKDISKRIQSLANKVSNFVIWFLTDGEETVYIMDNGNPDRIPSNPKDPKNDFFNVPDMNGLTKYQQQMIKDFEKINLKLADQQSALEFHVCHLGEAHPLFLKALQEAVDGHFHAVNDVANIAKEMAAQATATSGQITIVGQSGKNYKFPAALSDGALCSRGELPKELFDNDIAVITANFSLKIKTNNDERELNMAEVAPLGTQLIDGVMQILALEPALDTIMKGAQQNIDARSLNKTSFALKELRNKRMDAVTAVTRFIRSGTILQAFLEKVLETVENQIEALERFLLQYQSKEGQNYDKKIANQNDLFSTREKLAIEAGLESMRVRLGKGFVSQSSLDKKIQRLMAMHGPWARKMLNRQCFIAETMRGEDTLLTLFIAEGNQVSWARNNLLKDICNENEELGRLVNTNAAVEFKETLSHEADDSLMSTLRITVKGLTKTLKVEKKIPTLSLYTKPVATYTCKPNTEDLDDACKRLIDPLSFSSFLDLIRENNTLPAFLYSIGTDQPTGILFNAKELFYVIKGGSESTSFDYFRLYWRLARKDDQTKEVLVPGTFHKANCALPIAPEPLTNLVLSNLMPGLLSEFVTGSPMAPLTGIGLLYIGYLVMHMRASPHTGFDISRMSDILATLGCWIDNPNTLPKPEEFQEFMDSFVKRQGVTTGDSAGRHIPLKAMAFSIMDEKYPLQVKFEALQRETFRRNYRMLLVPRLGDEKNPQLAQSQTVMRSYLRQVFTDLAGNAELVDDIPVTELDTAETLVNLMFADRREKMKNAAVQQQNNNNDPNNNNKEASNKDENEEDVAEEHADMSATQQNDILNFMLQGNYLSVIANAVRKVLIEAGNKGFPQYAHFGQTQRLIFVWFALASYPFGKLKEAYRNFQSPAKFEDHVKNILDALVRDPLAFLNTVGAWIHETGNDIDFMIVNVLPNNSLELKSLKKGHVFNFGLDAPQQIKNLLGLDPEHKDKSWEPAKQAEVAQGLLSLWKSFKHMLEGHSSFWKGRKSNCYGLHELDYDVVKALKDSTLTLVGTLTQTQLAEFNKAKEHRNEAYAKFVAPKPQIARISDEHNTVVKQVAVQSTGKPHLSIIFIGNVDAGKSTLSGHLLYKCGGIDRYTMEKLAKDSAAVGKASFKYAWIMDKLRTERERGLTVETSMWRINTDERSLDIIDAPGHRDFIKNMSLGASLADAALLVVSAAPGEFEEGIRVGGMTREEALVAYTNGVRQFIVVVNKMDSVDFAASRFEEITSNVMPYLKKLGIDTARVPVIPVSAFLGDNMLEQSQNMTWWKGWNITLNSQNVQGLTLRDALNVLQPPARRSDLPLRIPILTVYKIGGIGTVAVGKVATGVLKQGQAVVLQPNGIQSEAGSIESFHSGLKEAHAGDLVGFNLKKISLKDVERGMVACDPNDRPCKPVSTFTATIVVLNKPGQIQQGYAPFFFAHTATFAGRFVQIVNKIDRKTGKVIEENPKSIKSGDSATVIIEPNHPIVVEPFSEIPQMGRFVIRDNSLTVAVGVVTATQYQAAKAKPTGPKKPSKFFH